MNIFDFAMKMEKDGEKFYRDLLEKTDNKGMKSILNMLADAEVEHYKTFEKMKSSGNVDYEADPILKKVKNVFQELKVSEKEFFIKGSQKTLYEEARELEVKSRDYYLEKAKEVDNEEYRSVLLKIAEEENKHFYLLDNIIEFISKPEKWVEHAEFYPYREY